MRRLLHGSARELGEAASAAAAERNFERSPAGQAVRALSGRGDDRIQLGRAMELGGAEQLLSLPRSAFVGRSLWTTGATGSGKSAYTLGLLLQFLTPKQRWPLVVVDGKSELAPWLTEEFLPATLAGWPAAEREALLAELTVVQSFAPSRLPALNVLTPVPGLSPALQAKEITTVITEALGSGAQVGLRMETILLHVLQLALLVGDLSLLEVRGILSSEAYRLRLVRQCPDPELRSYFSERFARERGESVQALLSRLDLLLLSPDAKRALSAKGMLDVPALLERGVSVIDVGSPPRGAEELGQFWMGILVPAVARAIMGRSPEAAKRQPALVVIDEWQTGLDAQLAQHFERLLTLARFKRVSLWLVNQLPAQVGAKHPTLLATLKNSAGLQVAFRQSLEDARTLAPLLPSEAEGAEVGLAERAAALTRLPERTCYLAVRALGLSAVKLRAPTVAFENVKEAARAAPVEVRGACRVGAVPAPPVAELDAVIAERLARMEQSQEPQPLQLGVPEIGSGKPARKKPSQQDGNHQPRETEAINDALASSFPRLG